MTRRRLSPEEVALWRRVAETTERLSPGQSPKDTVARPKPHPKRKPPAPPIQPFALGDMAQTASLTHDLAPGPGERLAKAPLRMDRKAHQKLKRGKLSPEGKLDLHGMTMDEAHPRLVRFILDAQAKGKRLVLVVTGKGKSRDEGLPIPVRHGVLRHQVPQWLALPPLSQAVLQVAEAHAKHGGGGAYYVYLRKGR